MHRFIVSFLLDNRSRSRPMSSGGRTGFTTFFFYTSRKPWKPPHRQRARDEIRRALSTRGRTPSDRNTRTSATQLLLLCNRRYSNRILYDRKTRGKTLRVRRRRYGARITVRGDVNTNLPITGRTFRAFGAIRINRHTWTVAFNCCGGAAGRPFVSK